MPFGHPLPKDFSYPEPQVDPADGGKLAVNPGDTIPAGCTLTPEDIAMVKRAIDHKASIYIYGEIRYRDVFGKPRLSPYCRAYDPDNRRQGPRLWRLPQPQFASTGRRSVDALDL
jgi:hypothetical protein